MKCYTIENGDVCEGIKALQFHVRPGTVLGENGILKDASLDVEFGEDLPRNEVIKGLKGNSEYAYQFALVYLTDDTPVDSEEILVSFNTSEYRRDPNYGDRSSILGTSLTDTNVLYLCKPGQTVIRSLDKKHTFVNNGGVLKKSSDEEVEKIKSDFDADLIKSRRSSQSVVVKVKGAAKVVN